MLGRWWIVFGLVLWVSQAQAADLRNTSCDWVTAKVLTNPGQRPNGGEVEQQLLDDLAAAMSYGNLGATSLGGKPHYPTEKAERYQLSILVLETCADHPPEMLDVRLSEIRWFEDERGLHADDKSFD